MEQWLEKNAEMGLGCATWGCNTRAIRLALKHTPCLSGTLDFLKWLYSSSNDQSIFEWP